MKLAGTLLVALSLSIGWGIRGNWGHEYGAMIPGALAALAACLLPGREDWRRRAVYFAFFGALGWSFGGSMSYGRVLGYTHSASLPDTVYGFAMTFVIGFLWGAVGGAGCALPAFLDRKRLVEFFPPLVAIFAAWLLMDAVALPLAGRGGFAQRLDWYDTDWLGVLVLIVATLAYVAWRRAISPAASLILQMAGGWWAGFLLLVVLLGLRMTPPRGDNWAGMLGMTVALLIYCFRNGLPAVAWTAIVTGTFAGVGFSFGLLVRGLGIASGIAANWHSVLEQSFGFIAGIGVALCMSYIAARSPRLQDDDDARDWTEPFALAFLLLAVTYLNISKNVWSVWLPNKVVPPAILGIPAAAWLAMAYALIAAVVITLILHHRRQPLAIVPATSLGKGQALFLLFLWWIAIGNLSRYLPFNPARLITEGVVHVNACIVSLLVVLVPTAAAAAPSAASEVPASTRKALAAALLVFIAASVLFSVILLARLDAPLRNAQFRFGPAAAQGW